MLLTKFLQFNLVKPVIMTFSDCHCAQIFFCYFIPGTKDWLEQCSGENHKISRSSRYCSFSMCLAFFLEMFGCLRLSIDKIRNMPPQSEQEPTTTPRHWVIFKCWYLTLVILVSCKPRRVGPRQWVMLSQDETKGKRGTLQSTSVA